MSSIALPLIVEYQNAPPAALFTRDIMGGFNAIYVRPWARIQTYIVGIWLGWIIYKTRGKSVKISPLVVAVCWLASTALALTVIFAIHPWFEPNNEIPKVSAYFYAGLSRLTWGVVVAWIIFACLKGYGGIVNSILSWKAFMPLGRLTFCVYLASFHLQMMYHARLTIPPKYDSYNIMYLFYAHLVMSLMVGFLCTMFFESPFIILQKLLLEGGSTSSRPERREKNDAPQDATKRHGIFYENTTNAILSGAPLAINMDDNDKGTGNKDS